MATSRELTLAEMFYDVLHAIEEKQSADSPMIPLDTISNCKSICEGIMSEGVVVKSTITSPFRYIGLENHAEEDVSKRPKVCRFAVERDGHVILECWYDRTLTWILQPKPEGGYRPVKRRPLPASVKSIRPYFKALAEKELDEPGSFAKNNYINDMPEDIDDVD